MHEDKSKITWRKFTESFQNLWIVWKLLHALTRAIMIKTSVF